MESTTTTTPPPPPPFDFLRPLPRRHFNRIFAIIYASAILSLLYHHILKLRHSATLITALLFISDVILAYMWSTTQAYRMNPTNRKEFPENLEKYILDNTMDYPEFDIFICTADPYKEPPINVVNTALSVMAYDYPRDKLSVYVSDDGGSDLTLFAFMEAAKFGKHWLPFCKENDVMVRCPDAYFNSSYAQTDDAKEIKMMYESMKLKLETVVERGKISDEYILDEEELKVLSTYWNKDFTRQNHPSVIKVLLNSRNDKDITNESMPNVIYVSREKNKHTTHHFKAGALNALLRVSATMSNAPIVLTLDCDMYSNDPRTPKRALCYLLDKPSEKPNPRPNIGYVQFPQRYHGLNEADIYGGEHKRLFQANPIGMDGLSGPNYVGTGCFFKRRAFFGGPSSYAEPEIPELGPFHIVDKPNNDEDVLKMAYHVSRCNYEDRTTWGTEMGFRNALVEDYYTGYRLQCEGWGSVFCNPKRPAFLGDVPISLSDVLGQNKRWAIGLFEVCFSKFSPLTFGIRSMGILMGQAYAHYAFWPIWSIPITVYAFLPSFCLLGGIPIFPKVCEPWFFVYVFLFLGAYAQDCLDFILTQGTFRRWWSDQRMWLIRGLSSYLFGSVEFIANHLGMETQGFNVTSKVMDDEQSKRYDKEMFEFGVYSPMFVSLTMAAILNLVAFLVGIVQILMGRNSQSFFIQMMICGFGVLNGFPLYEAMFFRSDKGRIPTKTTVTSSLVLGLVHLIASFALKI